MDERTTEGFGSSPGDGGPTDDVDLAGSAGPAGSGLSARDRRVLDFEGSWWLHPGPKDAAIRERVEVSSTRYYQAIRRLMDDPEAMAYAPLTVRRLQRMKRMRLDQIADRVRPGSSG